MELFPLKDRASISAYLGLLLEAPGFGYSPLKCVFTRFLAVSKVDCVADNGTIMGYREVDKALDIFLPYFKTTQGELYARRLVFFVIIAVLEYRREKSVLRSFEDLQGVLAYTW